MPKPRARGDSSTNVQIIVAVIGLVGIIAAAMISNWSNIFPKQPAQGTPVAGTPQKPPANPGRAIHSTGQLVVRGTWSCDLDAGAETNTGADFQWEQATATKRFISPMNGATFFVVGIRDFNSLRYIDLQRFSYSPQKIDGSDEPYNQIPQGTVVAYKTNEGRLGKFLVSAYGYNLSIRWVTFE